MKYHSRMSGKTFRDLVAGDGQRIAFFVIASEFAKADAIIKTYEESEAYVERCDSDLYIAILFFRRWQLDWYNYCQPYDKMIDTSDVDDQVTHFSPANASQKILYLLARNFNDLDDGQRCLRKAYQLARKDPSMIREFALVCFFMCQEWDMLEEFDLVRCAKEAVKCMDVVHGEASWQELNARIDLANILERKGLKDEAVKVFNGTLAATRGLEGEQKLLEARAIDVCHNLIPASEREDMDKSSRRILESYGSKDNPLMPDDRYIPRETSLQATLTKAMEQGEEPKRLLDIFSRNVLLRDEDDIIGSLEIVFPFYITSYDPSSEEAKSMMSDFRNAYICFRDTKRFDHWLLSKASAFGTDSDADQYLAFCDLVTNAAASSRLSICKVLEANTQPGCWNHVNLMDIKGKALSELGRSEEMMLCCEALVRGYEELGRLKDVRYWQAYGELASQYSGRKYIRRLRKAVEALEELAGPQSHPVADILDRMSTYYASNGSDESSFDYAMSVYDRLEALYREEADKRPLRLISVMRDRDDFLMTMNRLDLYAKSCQTYREAVRELMKGVAEWEAIADIEYGKALALTGKVEEAIPIFTSALDCFEDGSGEKLGMMATIIMLYMRCGRRKEAYGLAQKLRPFEKKLGNMDRTILYSSLSQMYEDRGDYKASDRMRYKADRYMPEMPGVLNGNGGPCDD